MDDDFDDAEWEALLDQQEAEVLAQRDPLEEWTDKDEAALEEWEERRRERLAELNEY